MNNLRETFIHLMNIAMDSSLFFLELSKLFIESKTPANLDQPRPNHTPFEKVGISFFSFENKISIFILSPFYTTVYRFFFLSRPLKLIKKINWIIQALALHHLPLSYSNEALLVKVLCKKIAHTSTLSGLKKYFSYFFILPSNVK